MAFLAAGEAATAAKSVRAAKAAKNAKGARSATAGRAPRGARGASAAASPAAETPAAPPPSGPQVPAALTDMRGAPGWYQKAAQPDVVALSNAGGGFLLGLFAWAVGLAYLRGGGAEVKRLLNAKFFNKTDGAPPVGAGAAANPSVAGYTRPADLPLNTSPQTPIGMR